MTEQKHITQEQLAEWRKLRGAGMESAIGEYTPPEFWQVLDELEQLHALLADLGPQAILFQFVCAMLHDQHRRVSLGLKASPIVGAPPVQQVGYQWTIVSSVTSDFAEAIAAAHEAFIKSQFDAQASPPAPANVREIFPGPRKGK